MQATRGRHTRETMQRTRAIEAATNIVANHHAHTIADTLEICDLQELAELDRLDAELDTRRQAVIKRMWERNKSEDRRHAENRTDALCVAGALEKSELAAVSPAH